MERLWRNAQCSGSWTAQQMDAYQISLFLPENSLFFKIFSLLICVGNCSRSGCSTAVSCYEIDSQSPRIAKFPVKFPVSRELPTGDRFVSDCAHHHPVFRFRTPRVIRAFVPRIAGFFKFAPVSASVSARQKGGFDLLSLHPKILFPALRFCGGMSFACCLVRSPLTGSSSAP